MIAALVIARICKQQRRALNSLLHAKKRRKHLDKLETVRDKSDIPEDLDLERMSSCVSSLSGSRSKSIRGRVPTAKRGTKKHPISKRQVKVSVAQFEYQLVLHHILGEPPTSL